MDLCLATWGWIGRRLIVSDADNYAPGTYNDPNAPWNQEDITETDAFQDKQAELWNDRILDISWMVEGITERSDIDLNMLARLIKGNQTGSHTTTIGAFITKWVNEYTEPDDSEVISELEKDNE